MHKLHSYYSPLVQSQRLYRMCSYIGVPSLKALYAPSETTIGLHSPAKKMRRSIMICCFEDTAQPSSTAA